MTDLLIRDVPQQEAVRADSPVRTEDLHRFTQTFADLNDPDPVARAWR